MDNDDIKLLLARYITRQPVSDAEAEEMKHWLGLHLENELYFIELYEAWQNMLYIKPENIDEEKAYKLFLAKITPEKQSAGLAKWVKIAAVLLVFIVPAILIIRQFSNPHKEKNRVIAHNGSVKKLLLADGTIVWLNAGSTIKYDDDFGKTNRTVYLEGEAFFEIGHHIKNIPFLVNTKNYTIRDIGTKFNLKAYPNDPFFETTVIKGEVSVEDNQSAGDPHSVNRIYVKPHQVLKIFYHPQKDFNKGVIPLTDSYNDVSVLQLDSAKMDVYSGWKDNLLIFDGNTLGEISKVLERRYNVQIMLKSDQLEDIRYSGSFKNVPDINAVLHIIKQNTPIDYTIEGHTITINKTN